MGAWGTGTFENDTACDWYYGLKDVDDLSLVRDAIDKVLATSSDFLDSGVAVEALAACEILARLQGRWGTRDAYTETVDVWVAAHPIDPPADLLQKAIVAIDRVISEPSELLELWDEGGRNDAWHAAVADLRQRVENAKP